MFQKMKIQEKELDQVQKAVTEELKFCNKKHKHEKMKKELQMWPERAYNKTIKQQGIQNKKSEQTLNKTTKQREIQNKKYDWVYNKTTKQQEI